MNLYDIKKRDSYDIHDMTDLVSVFDAACDVVHDFRSDLFIDFQAMSNMPDGYVSVWSLRRSGTRLLDVGDYFRCVYFSDTMSELVFILDKHDGVITMTRIH